MAKNYLVITFPAPANPSATAVAGGSLVAGTTYYYRVAAVNHATTGITIIGEYCAEVSATTDATNKQISLTWDAVTGATGYFVFRTVVSGNYNTNTTHKIVTTGYATTATNSFTDTGAYTLIKQPLTEMPEIRAWEGTYADPITPQNIADYLVANGYTRFVKANTQFEGGGGLPSVVHIIAAVRLGVNSTFNNITSYFKISQGSQFMVEGRFTAYSACSFYMGTKVTNSSPFGSYGRYGAALFIKSTHYMGGNMAGLTGPTYIYNSIIKTIDDDAVNTTSFDSTFFISVGANASEVIGTLIHSGGNSSFGGRLTIIGCLMSTSAWFQVASGYSPEVIKTLFFYDSPIYDYYGSSPTFDGLTIVASKGATYEMRFHRNNTTVNTITRLDTPFLATYPTLPNASAGANSVATIYLEKYRFNVTVVDSDGNAIEGATVTLKDKDDTQSFTDDTDSLGEITEQQVLIRDFTGIGAASGTTGTTTVYSYNDYNDHTLTITKDGYETIIDTITISGKTGLNYTLKSQITKLEDDNGNVFDRVDKTNSGTTNLRRKIVKAS